MTAMKIGISLGETANDPLGALRDQIAQAEADGFTSGWLAHIFGVDALTALAVAGAGSGLELGTAVVPTFPRHPAALAQQASTVQDALGGRLVLGIGLSHQIVIEGMFGYSFDKPARHMREYLDVLIPLLRDGRVDVTGDTISGHLTMTAPRTHTTPVLLAALAPVMLRLAGAVADGTILWMTGHDTVVNHVVPKLTAAAADAGRSAPRVVCILPVAVTDDVAAARERAAKVFAVYGQLPSYRAMLDLEGAAGPADVAIVGDEAVVRGQIAALAEAGVSDFVAAPFVTGSDGERTRELLVELAAG